MTELGIYLDYNAGAPVREPVAEAMRSAALRAGNPSSVHRFGSLARRTVESAREQVAGLGGWAPEDVVFTSGGTEANNLAIHGAGRRTIFVSAVEHDSVLAPARRGGHDCHVVPVDGEGVADLAVLDAALDACGAPALVSIMLANNETGVIQPVAEVAAIAHRHGALFHCDAVQGPGKIPLDAARNADLVSLSAHKFGGPMGVGALIVRGAELVAQMTGGGQERRRRAGTENVPGIAGFGLAAELSRDDLAAADEIQSLRDDIEARLEGAGARVFGAGATRLGNTSCLSMPGVAAETQVMAFDLDGIAVSAGAACSSGKVGPSHVLAAMGIDPDEAATAIRLSLGRATEPAHIGKFVESWMALNRRAGPAATRGRNAA